MLTQKDQDRFWSKALIKGVDDCWEWQRGKTKNGHGVFSIKGKWIGAHVVAFICHYGYRPKLPAMVIHTCENPGCVNPWHLLEGNAKLNGNYPGCIEKCRVNIRDRKWFGTRGKAHPRWGMKHSPEAKAKMSLAAKKTWRVAQRLKKVSRDTCKT